MLLDSQMCPYQIIWRIIRKDSAQALTLHQTLVLFLVSKETRREKGGKGTEVWSCLSRDKVKQNGYMWHCVKLFKLWTEWQI